MIIDNSYCIKIDSSQCTSLVTGGTFVGQDNFFDIWRYDSLQFESGNIYALVGEHGQGCMYLSYLLGGKVDFGDLKIYMNESEIRKQDLELISWNLEPSEEKYGNAVFGKSIKRALVRNNSKESFSDIQDKFLLTQPRFGSKLKYLSGERWRASAALGYAERRRIFYAPYKTSKFYYDMCQSGLLKALRELTDAGAIVLLPVGSDEFVKYIADQCIYVKSCMYNINDLRQRYKELFDRDDCIFDKDI